MRLDDGAVLQLVSSGTSGWQATNFVKQLNHTLTTALPPSSGSRITDSRRNVLALVTHMYMVVRVLLACPPIHQTAIGRSLSVLMLMLILLSGVPERIRGGNYGISIGFSNAMGQMLIPYDL